MSRVSDALNRLAKWRVLLTGWQVGTRAKGDPEADAVKDHREATLLLRVESSAIANLLIEKKVFTKEEFEDQLVVECDELHKMLERRFPGVSATATGLVFDERAKDTLKGFPR